MAMRHRSPALLTLLAFLLGASATPAALPPQDPAPEEQEEQEPKRLEAWPAVDQKAVRSELARLRKARTAEMGRQGQAALIALGSGAAPLVIDKLSQEKGEDALERMHAVLEAVTDARHTRLLAERFGDKAAPVRLWCLRRVAIFPDPGTRPAAEEALKAAEGRKRKLDPAEVLAAALCCAASGSFEGFDVLCAAAEEDWGDHREALVIALGPLRGEQATARVLPYLEESSRKRKLLGLRLLSACGEAESAVPKVRPFLDETDNSLRVGAINALRGIVDGDPPLPRLSVFEAIERANKWKARL